MQSWEEYEADYYGEVPYNRRGQQWGRRSGMLPYEPEDRMDTRMRDGYAGEGRMERDGYQRDRDRWTDRDMDRRRSDDWGDSTMYPESRRFAGSRERDRDMTMRYPLDENETWRDMEEFEGLYDELADEITEVIRQICDSIDGEGCAAMEGQLTHEILEMMIDRVQEQLGTSGQMGDENQPGNAGQTVPEEGDLLGAAAGGMRDSDALRRSLIRALLFHELLRRRMRRRMRRRNREEYRR